MKAFVLKEKGSVGFFDAPEPVLDEYGAILKPLAVSPCSSDVHLVYGGGSPKEPNLILGHECVAEIVEVGKKVKDFCVGDRVAVPAITPDWHHKSVASGNLTHGGKPFSGHQLGRTSPGVFAEHFAVPDADMNLAKIPAEVSDEQALMCVDVMTTGFTGAENAGIKIGSCVCVFGIGPIGLMAVAGARMLGAGRIFAIGSRPNCALLAKTYGATDVLNYKTENINDIIMNETGGIGVDSVIIAGGDNSILTTAYDIVKYGTGTISNVNYLNGTGFVEIPIFSGGRGMCGKTLRMELAKGGRERMENLLDMVKYGRIDPSALVTHHLYGLGEIEKALVMMRDKTDGVIKIMVHC